jgi:hypothetical protein
MSDTIQTTDPRGSWTSASNAAADFCCPGRHTAQAGLPDEPGEYAEVGRKIHAALACEDGNPPSGLSLEERETFDACRAIEAGLCKQFFGDGPMNRAENRFRVFREQRYWAKFTKDGKEYAHSGQPDVVFRSGMRALICDYKVMHGDVPESPKNLQLRDQAVLVRGNLIPTDEIAVAIIQPWVTHKPELCLYDKAALEESTKRMFDRVVASNQPDAKRIPGELQCKYCKARKVCLEYQKWAGAIAPPAMLNLLDVPMASWTPEQISRAASALGPCQKLLDDIKAMLKDRLTADPNSVPGWALEPGAKRETITNPQVCFDRFAALGGNIERFMLCVSVTKGKLKTALNDVTGAKGKALDAAMKTLTEGIVDVKETAPSLKKVEVA